MTETKRSEVTPQALAEAARLAEVLNALRTNVVRVSALVMGGGK